MIVFSEDHLRRILESYVTYYRGARTHLCLDRNAPEPRRVESHAMANSSPSPTSVVCTTSPREWPVRLKQDRANPSSSDILCPSAREARVWPPSDRCQPTSVAPGHRGDSMLAWELQVVTRIVRSRTGFPVWTGVSLVDGDNLEVTGDHTRHAQHRREYDAVLSATTAATSCAHRERGRVPDHS